MSIGLPHAGTTRPHWEVQPTQLIGRASELKLVRNELLDDRVRLLTLTGPAGVGKTRLSAEVGIQLDSHFPQGVVLADFESERDPDRVMAVLAQAVKLPGNPNEDTAHRLQGFLEDRSMLLILDNFDRVNSAAPQLGNLLSSCCSVKMLVTSRGPLYLRWEHTIQLPPLPVPDLSEPVPLEQLIQVPSVELFVERVRANNPLFVLDNNNAHSVSEICVELDGLPLAIELAAARSTFLSPGMILERLKHRLSLLRWDAPDLPKRQHTLRSAIDWSYDLLESKEQLLFRHLGPFVGGFDLPAAEETAAPWEGCPNGVLDGITSLVAKSLIQVEGQSDALVRYSLLESAREYAVEQLRRCDELETAERNHAHYYLKLGEQAEPHVRAPAQHLWLLRLFRDHSNLVSALQWLHHHNQHEPALRLATVMSHVSLVQGTLADGCSWLDKTLKNAPGADPEIRANALAQLALLSILRGDYRHSRHACDEVRVVMQESQNCSAIAQCLIYRSGGAALQGRWTECIELLKDALDHTDGLNDQLDVGFALRYIGIAASKQNRHQEALSHYHEILSRLRDMGDVYAGGLCLFYLALTQRELGDLSRAVEHLQDGIQTSMDSRSRLLLSIGIDAALRLGGDQERPEARAQLCGARAALNQETGVSESVWEPWSAQSDAKCKAELERDGWGAAVREGQCLSIERIAQLVGAELNAVSPRQNCAAPSANGARQDLLSGRELEVLQQVAEGHSSKVIGKQLFISVSTVNYHLTSIFNKLGVDTRAQAVAVAARHGLLDKASSNTAG